MRDRLVFARICMLAGALGSSGCALMPQSGPDEYSVFSQAELPDSLPYAFVKITPSILPILAHNAPGLYNSFADRRPPSDILLGVGDVVSVTIFEAAAGGLFIPAEAGVRPGNYVTIPNQAVDSSGNIQIPYAGTIRAKGRTVAEVQQAIVNSIKNRAIEPQAVVSVVAQNTSMISVLGEVNSPTRFAAPTAGMHILDAITKAGGPKSQGYDTWVMLERGGRRALAPFGALVYQPRNNIWAHPDDTLYLFSEPQTFLAFGATGGGGGGSVTGNQAQVNFGAWQISLAEAIAKAGGLLDSRANPAAVFLYRGETRKVAEKLGVDVSRFEGPIIPIIYNVNMRDPAGIFLAQSFRMRNKDVIYVANTTSVQVSKFLSYLSQISGTIDDPVLTATDIYNLIHIGGH